MRPGVAILSLFIYVLAALAALHRRPTPAHGLSRPRRMSIPLLENLSWLLPEVTPDDLRSTYATGSTKPVVAQ